MNDTAALSHFFSFSLETNENCNATATEIIKIKLFTPQQSAVYVSYFMLMFYLTNILTLMIISPF